MLYKSKNPHGGDVYGGNIKLDFSANINPLGTPQSVFSAIENSFSDLFRYPDPYCRKLVEALSRFEGVDEDCILCGNGAAELIYSYTQALTPKKVVELAPTFLEYKLALENSGASVIDYILNASDDFKIGEDFISFVDKQAPDAVMICNPNNPNGRLMDENIELRLFELCKSRDINLFIDECFLDLSDGGISMKPYLKSFPGLFILKAFTKTFAMAGLRLGYCMSSNPALLEKMASCVQPWNVSAPAQNAGVAALCETGFIDRSKDYISRRRECLIGELKELVDRVFETNANFILFKSRAHLEDELLKKDIKIRDCSNYNGLKEGYYRVAVRSEDDNKTLIAALKEVLNKE